MLAKSAFPLLAAIAEYEFSANSLLVFNLCVLYLNAKEYFVTDISKQLLKCIPKISSSCLSALLLLLFHSI